MFPPWTEGLKGGEETDLSADSRVSALDLTLE